MATREAQWKTVFVPVQRATSMGVRASEEIVAVILACDERHGLVRGSAALDGEDDRC